MMNQKLLENYIVLSCPAGRSTSRILASVYFSRENIKSVYYYYYNV